MNPSQAASSLSSVLVPCDLPLAAMIVPNDSLFLVYDHFEKRVNREGHLHATLDGSTIFLAGDPKIASFAMPSQLYPFHINYFTFGKLFEILDGKRHLQIVETGTSANAVDSTSLFDTYARTYDSRLVTIDIDPSRAIGASVRWSKETTAVTSDSVAYLRSWAEQVGPNKKMDVVYLDSWDIDWLNPEPSQSHGLAEFNSILPHLADEAYILIDDTPASPEWLPFRNATYEQVKQQVELGGQMPGKGAYVHMIIKQDPRFQVIAHQYQLLLKYTASST